MWKAVHRWVGVHTRVSSGFARWFHLAKRGRPGSEFENVSLNICLDFREGWPFHLISAASLTVKTINYSKHGDTYKIVCLFWDSMLSNLCRSWTCVGNPLSGRIFVGFVNSQIPTSNFQDETQMQIVHIWTHFQNLDFLVTSELRESVKCTLSMYPNSMGICESSTSACQMLRY